VEHSLIRKLGGYASMRRKSGGLRYRANEKSLWKWSCRKHTFSNLNQQVRKKGSYCPQWKIE